MEVELPLLRLEAGGFALWSFPPRPAFAPWPFPPRPVFFVGSLHSADTVAVGARGLEYDGFFKKKFSADLVAADSAFFWK